MAFMNDTSSPRLERIVRETGQSPSHAIIWLHGLGADGHDFEPIVPQLGAAAAWPVRFIFPHAPMRPVTINGGMTMRAWYDIRELSIDRNQDHAGIAASLTAVDRLIDEQIEAGIPAERIVLAGFSQGGAIALRCGLARQQRLAGIVALSCYLLDGQRLGEWIGPSAGEVPVFMGHGELDPVVPVALGQAAANSLKQHGVEVLWQSWSMPHSVCVPEIEAIDRWLNQIWR